MHGIKELAISIKNWFCSQPKFAQITMVGLVAFAIIAYAMSLVT